jgi:HD-GYP domain-containing protein (c-di-GMP phosphodiesterase class II)
MNESKNESNTEEILNLLFSYMPKIAEERKMDGLLILMADLGRSLVGADRCSLWLIDENKGEMWTKVAHGVDELRIPMNLGFVGHTVKTGESLCIKDAYKDSRFDSRSDQKTTYHTQSVLTVPLKNSEGAIIGVFQAINKKNPPYYFSPKDVEYLSLTAVYSGKTLESALLTKELEDTQAEILNILGEVSEHRSKETADHVTRVAASCYKMACYLGLSEYEANKIRLAAPLHDLGKVAIPDAILQKTGKFTPEEYEVMKTHTVMGHHLLKSSSRKLLQLAAEMAIGHHEHWDGSGYPKGLSGENIPLSSRICAVVDVFDALSSARCYKEAWSEEMVKDFFIKQKDHQFQKELIDILLLHWDDFISEYK